MSEPVQWIRRGGVGKGGMAIQGGSRPRVIIRVGQRNVLPRYLALDRG
jgi:hypothetical protein